MANYQIRNDCFTTEINHIPSKYSKNLKMIPERKVLLQNEFFRSFSKIIIGAKTYLTPKEISNLFNIPETWEEIKLDEIGKKRKRSIKAYIWKNDSQTIISCKKIKWFGRLDECCNKRIS